MTAVIETEGAGRRYRWRWALRDCSLRVPAGRVVGLVGANGAGKTTLLHLVVGLLRPSAGTVRVWGEAAALEPRLLARIGFVAQDAPLYRGLTVGDHVRLGRQLNPSWDDGRATERITTLGLDPDQRAGELSGGQRSQLALTLAVAKQPELLVLDEPVARLDPLARREFLQDLMEAVADQGLTVVLSSHLLSDVERICDHVIVLASGGVQLAGDVDDLLAGHRVVSGPRCELADIASSPHVVQASHTDRQSTLVLRTDGVRLDPAWSVAPIGLEELVLAYMSPRPQARSGHPRLALVEDDR